MIKSRLARREGRNIAQGRAEHRPSTCVSFFLRFPPSFEQPSPWLLHLGFEGLLSVIPRESPYGSDPLYYRKATWLGALLQDPGNLRARPRRCAAGDRLPLLLAAHAARKAFAREVEKTCFLFVLLVF